MTAYKPKIRLYVECPIKKGEYIHLDRDQTHYLARVMRKKTGDQILLFNGKDGEWESEITGLERNQTTLMPQLQTRQQKAEPDLWLVFAPIKRARLDFIAQKATELGVSDICPVITQYTNVDRVKSERLAANAIEAAEQCERLKVPTIHPVCSLQDLLENWPEERHILFCSEDLSGPGPEKTLADLSPTIKKSPWAIFIGPEGGFSPSERHLIKAFPHTVTMSLGPRILRADTAAIAALSLWQAMLGDW